MPEVEIEEELIRKKAIALKEFETENLKYKFFLIRSLKNEFFSSDRKDKIHTSYFSRTKKIRNYVASNFL